MNIILSIFALILLIIQPAFSTCDCGSEDTVNPCTGNQIDVTVGTDRSVEFSWVISSGGQEAYCGQFANGDYWIAPRDGQTEVTVSSLTSSGSGPVSLDENAQLETLGLLSSDPNVSYGNYVASENIISALPANFSNNTSLVAAIQKDETTNGECGAPRIVGNCAEAYHIVTVLNQIPENAGASILRPSFDEQDKELLSLSDFDFSRIPSLDFMPTLSEAQIEAIRERWSHNTEVFSIMSANGQIISEGGRAFRADLLVDDYAAGRSVSYYSDVLGLMSPGNTEAQTRAAWAAILTYGKDLYYAVYNGTERTRGWGTGAGQHVGKFPAAVLFAALYEDTYYQDVLRQTSLTLLGHNDPLRGYGPQELEQINIGLYGEIWGDSPDQMGRYDIGSYWQEMLDGQCYDGATGTCYTNGGRKTGKDPHNIIDGPPKSPGTQYMITSAGPIRGFVALAHMIPEVCETMNYPPLISYTDRIENGGLRTSNDICAPPDNREILTGPNRCDAYRAQNCQYYGLSNTGVATWGPTTFDSQPACVLNNSGGNTGQNGRYPHMHGNPMPVGYRVRPVEDNWEVIRNLKTACNLNDLIFVNGFESLIN